MRVCILIFDTALLTLALACAGGSLVHEIRLGWIGWVKLAGTGYVPFRIRDPKQVKGEERTRQDNEMSKR